MGPPPGVPHCRWRLLRRPGRVKGTLTPLRALNTCLSLARCRPKEQPHPRRWAGVVRAVAHSLRGGSWSLLFCFVGAWVSCGFGRGGGRWLPRLRLGLAARGRSVARAGPTRWRHHGLGGRGCRGGASSRRRRVGCRAAAPGAGVPPVALASPRPARCGVLVGLRVCPLACRSAAACWAASPYLQGGLAGVPRFGEVRDGSASQREHEALEVEPETVKQPLEGSLND